MKQLNDPVGQCPACQSTEARPVWPGQSKSKFSLQRCVRCRLAYTVPQLSSSEIVAYYDEHYYGKKNVRFRWWMERLVRWCRRRRADKICQFVPRGTILDIGCGRGHILYTLRERGWTVRGIELSEDAVHHSRDKLGLDVSIESFDPDRFESAAFDVIVLWHVMEHLPDVGRALRGLERMLKPGGLLAISVPNFGSWQAVLTRDRWFHLDLPRHYCHFSESWLRDALESLGLTVFEVNHFAFEQNPFGWIQSVLNCCGLRHNLLYELLKSTSARRIEHPLRQYPWESLASYFGLGLLFLPACLMLIPEVLFQRGATIDVFAIKKR